MLTLLPLFIAGVILTAISCVLWLIGLGLYLWLLSLQYRLEALRACGWNAVVVPGKRENSPEVVASEPLAI